MQSVETTARIGVVVALCGLTLGCAILPEAMQSLGASSEAAPARAPASVAAASANSASTTATEAVAAPVRAEAQPEVAPAVQRAFDDARRAMRAGRLDEAERGLHALTKSNPELGGPHANLGLIYLRTGKTAEAVAALERAVDASPKQAIYFNHLGIAYRQHGEFKKAGEAYDKAITLDPGYPAPVLNLGILSDLYLADGKRALELYGQYLALAAGDDAVVTKWVADLKNRKPQQAMLNLKERP